MRFQVVYQIGEEIASGWFEATVWADAYQCCREHIPPKAAVLALLDDSKAKMKKTKKNRVKVRLKPLVVA